MRLLLSIVKPRKRGASRHTRPFLETRWGRDATGAPELRIVAGGTDLDELEGAIADALHARLGPLTDLTGFGGRILVAILPGLTPDTPALRGWRMQLQRALREQAAAFGFRLCVEYERWRQS